MREEISFWTRNPFSFCPLLSGERGRGVFYWKINSNRHQMGTPNAFWWGYFHSIWHDVLCSHLCVAAWRDVMWMDIGKRAFVVGQDQHPGKSLFQITFDSFSFRMSHVLVETQDDEIQTCVFSSTTTAPLVTTQAVDQLCCSDPCFWFGRSSKTALDHSHFLKWLKFASFIHTKTPAKA